MQNTEINIGYKIVSICIHVCIDYIYACIYAIFFSEMLSSCISSCFKTKMIQARQLFLVFTLHNELPKEMSDPMLSSGHWPWGIICYMLLSALSLISNLITI